MRFGWIVLLVLSFPVLEAISIFWMAGLIGVWVLLWMLAAVVAGVLLIRFERAAWGARLLFSLRTGQRPFSALFASGRILLAGGLFVFPGFISDVLALILLLIPGTWSRRPGRAANDDAPPPEPRPTPRREEAANTAPKTIDGEYRREPDDLRR